MQTVETKPEGAVTYWQIGKPVNLLSLRLALSARRLEWAGDLLAERTDDSALKAALRVRHPEALIRRLRGRGFEVVAERRGAETNDYQHTVSAWRDGDAIKTDNGITAELAAEVDSQRNLMPAGKVGTWLADCCRRMTGTTLRPTGGIYWLPPESLADWSALAAAIEEAAPGAYVFMLRTAWDERSIRAIREAIIHEAASETAALTAELADDTDCKLRESTLNRRLASCEALRSKLTRYESLIGETLDAVRKSLGEYETAAAQAILVRSASESVA